MAWSEAQDDGHMATIPYLYFFQGWVGSYHQGLRESEGQWQPGHGCKFTLFAPSSAEVHPKHLPEWNVHSAPSSSEMLGLHLFEQKGCHPQPLSFGPWWCSWCHTTSPTWFQGPPHVCLSSASGLSPKPQIVALSRYTQPWNGEPQPRGAGSQRELPSFLPLGERTMRHIPSSSSEDPQQSWAQLLTAITNPIT